MSKLIRKSLKKILIYISIRNLHGNICQKCDHINKIKALNNDEEDINLMEEYEAFFKISKINKKIFKILRFGIIYSWSLFRFFFRLIKNLPYPKLIISIAYWKHIYLYFKSEFLQYFHDNNVYCIQLCLCIFKSIASRSSQEVGSCKHLKNLRNEKQVIAYSHMCSGQKRNIKIILTWLKIVQFAK